MKKVNVSIDDNVHKKLILIRNKHNLSCLDAAVELTINEFYIPEEEFKLRKEEESK